MQKQNFLVLIILFIIGGCGQITVHRTSANHPANPQAASGNLAATGELLNIDEGNLPNMPREMQDSMRMPPGGGGHDTH